MQEQNSLARWLSAKGTPRADWSDTDLREFETKLNRLESVERELVGRPGIYGASNTTLIAQARAALASAREIKVRLGGFENAVSRMTELDNELIQYFRDLRAQGDDIGSFTVPQLTSCLETVQKMTRNIDEQESLFEANRALIQEPGRIRSALDERRRRVNELKNVLESVLKLKTRAA